MKYLVTIPFPLTSFCCLFFFIVMQNLQTIGQAYEDMQTQNQHLLQQVTERDEYNIKVFFNHLYISVFNDF